MTPTHPIAQMIDHTLLKPEATAAQVQQLCLEARQYQFASVCINPVFVPMAAEWLTDSPVKVCTVIGFPLGANTPEVKAFESQQALARGAHELDMVLNVGALKAGQIDRIITDIRAVVQMAKAYQALVKVIFEIALLSDDEIVAACQASLQAGADFVKTSTGFGPGGATIAAVTLMRATVGPNVGVKAAGGIRTLADAEAMVAAGANRLGASAGVAIVQAALGQTPPEGSSTGNY